MTVTKKETGEAAEPQRSRGRPQQRSDEETRTLILQAARAEFAVTGYAATAMESVARRARDCTTLFLQGCRRWSTSDAPGKQPSGKRTFDSQR